MSFLNDFEHLKVQLKDIRSATNNFSDNPIGIGGFGKVYKGELSLPEGRKMVAFKRLDRQHGQGDIEFWKEVMMLSQYRHENLISLLHFCNEDSERILVYEYASRGSLDGHLGDPAFTWTQRLKICLGAAHGLNYLHDPVETQQRVLHRDIKSANILIDEKFTAKVSDFGLSKFGPANQEHTYLISNALGTPGYCDPLYWEMGCLSKESDVYSFGVVLFEVLCGRRCFEYRNGDFHILVRMWKKCYAENRLDDIICHHLKDKMDSESLTTYSSIANRCLHTDREERPTMAEIIEKLEIALDQQEMYENVDIEQINRIATLAATPLSYGSPSELVLLISKGILLNDGKTWLSVNKCGQNHVTISARECMFTYPTHQRWKHHAETSDSRLQGETYFSIDSTFQIEVCTRFLSPHATYTVNLVYRFEHYFTEAATKIQRQISCQVHHVPFRYKLFEETEYSKSCIAQKKGEWLSTELYQFDSCQNEHDFTIQFLSQAHRHHYDGLFVLKGIEFQPANYEKDENAEDENEEDMQQIIGLEINWEQKLPNDWAKIIKWSKDNMQWNTMKEVYYLFRKGFFVNKNGQQWFYISKNMKKCHMRPAIENLQKKSNLRSQSDPESSKNMKKWPTRIPCANLQKKLNLMYLSDPESRFGMVVDCSEIKSFVIDCDIGFDILSPQTVYACYLVYKLPKEQSTFEGIVEIHRTGRVIQLIYLLTPPHTPVIVPKVHQELHIPTKTRKVKGHPKLRKDGWMEIQVMDFDNDVADCRLSSHNNQSFTGLVVQGIDIRPSKIAF